MYSDKPGRVIPPLPHAYFWYGVAAHRYVDTGRKKGNVVITINPV